MAMETVRVLGNRRRMAGEEEGPNKDKRLTREPVSLSMSDDPFPSPSSSSSCHASCTPNLLESTPLEVLALITSFLDGVDTLLLYQVSSKLLRSKLALQGGITQFSLSKTIYDGSVSYKPPRNTVLNIQTFSRLPSAIFMFQRLHTFKYCFPDTIRDLDADLYLLLKRLPATLKSLYLKACNVRQFVVIRPSSLSPLLSSSSELAFHPLASMFPDLERLTLSDHRQHTQSFPITGFLKVLPPMLTHLKVSFIHLIKTKHLEWMPKFISSIAFRPPPKVTREKATTFPIVREALESFGPKLSALKCFTGPDVVILQLHLPFLQELSCRELSVAQLEALPRGLKKLSCSRDTSSKDEILWQQALPREALEYFRDVGFFRKLPQSFIPASLTHLEYCSSTPALIPLLSDLPCASRLTILTMNASYPQFNVFNDGLRSLPRLPKLTRLSCNFGFSYIESDHLERLPSIQELHLPASDFVDTALLNLPRDLYFLHINTVFVTGALLDPSVTHLDVTALSSWKKVILAKYPQLTMRILTSAWSRDLSPCSSSILTHDEVILNRVTKSFQNLPKSLTQLNLERLVNLHFRDLPRSITRIKISVVIFLDSYLADLSTLHAITFDSCTFSIPSQLVTSYWSAIGASLPLLANTATTSTPKSESEPAISCAVEQRDLPIVSRAGESQEESGISVPSDFAGPLLQILLPQHRFDSCEFQIALSTSILELLRGTSHLSPNSVTCINFDHAREPIESSCFLIPPPPPTPPTSPSPFPLSSPSLSPVGVLPSSDPQARFPNLKTLICTRVDQPVLFMNLSMVRSMLPYFPNLTRLEISGLRDAPRSLQLPSGLLTLRIVKCRFIHDYTLPASLVTLIVEDPMQFTERACQHVGSLPHLKTLIVTPPGRPEQLKKLLPPSLTHIEM